MQSWSPISWLNKDCTQIPRYPDDKARDAILALLHESPPLVSPLEIQTLQQSVTAASQGDAFLLQGGDCAESFSNTKTPRIIATVALLTTMGDILCEALKKPVVHIGRIAGQYAKPRSYDTETQNGQTLPAYRGDLINDNAFCPIGRTPNPERLLTAYQMAEHTLQTIRTRPQPAFLYTAHEALHLYYETALTRTYEDHWYLLSTHFPWIGMRTAQRHSAHIEFMRGIANPIGIKIGPSLDADTLCDLLTQLNPHHIKGRIMLITRLGNNTVKQRLPSLIRAVQKTKIPVTWSCDPMHGNTELTTQGFKTRCVETIWQELEKTITIHQALDTPLGGVHFELTSDPVTECLGGPDHITEEQLSRAYHTLLDPRLNHTQSLEITKRLGEVLRR